MRIRDPGWQKIRIRDPGLEKFGSGIKIPDPKNCERSTGLHISLNCLNPGIKALSSRLLLLFILLLTPHPQALHLPLSATLCRRRPPCPPCRRPAGPSSPPPLLLARRNWGVGGRGPTTSPPSRRGPERRCSRRRSR
jgi:hypothetical protein